MTNTPLIATSIAPNNRLEIQKKAIDSWNRGGFAISSLNTPIEIDALKNDFPEVQFIPQLRTAQAFVGKPMIFIADILQYLKSTSSTNCAIVNSDIFFTAPTEFHALLLAKTKDSFVYAPRYEVDRWDSDHGHFDLLGFDLFAFDRSFISDWPESHFCLGMPSWDHWFPLLSVLAGRSAKKIISSTIRHIPHDVRC